MLAGERPVDVFTHQRGSLFPAISQCLDDGVRGRRVAQGHRQISLPLFEAGAAHRRAFGFSLKSVLIPRKKTEQRGSLQAVSGLKIWLGAQLGVAIPWAVDLTVVATVDTVADERAELDRNGGF